MTPQAGRILAVLLAGALTGATSPGLAADSTAVAPPTESAAPAAASDTTQAGPTPAKAKGKSKPKSKSKSKEKSMAAGTMPVKPAIAPAHVEVQHILIGFAGSIEGKTITRTKEEASKLAHEILEKARNGANFDSLVAKYTDDSPPGIYRMAADGVPPTMGEFRRRQMVPAFGNVGFSISPGNIDIAEFDPVSSPFGWHIIKRLR